MASATASSRSVLMIEAVAAARLGQKGLARRLFNEIVEKDPHAEHALLWIAALADTPDEAIRALEQVLLINPANEQAMKALEVQKIHQVASPTEVPLPPPAIRALPAGPFQRATAVTSLQTSVAATPQTPPAAAAPKPEPARFQKAIRRIYHCPICRAEHLAQPARCPDCGCYLDLENLAQVAENRGADEEILRKAVEAWQVRMAAEPYDANVNIARALLSLNRSAEALVSLHAALTLDPGNGVLREAAGQLQSRKLVVAVDGSPSMRKLLAVQLDRRGYRVLTAKDGLSALSRMANFAPDLVLLDAGLPKLNGYEICRILRRHEDFRNVPVVLLSAKAGLLDRLKGRIAGATEFLAKPIEAPDLMRAIAKHLVEA